MGFYDRTVGGIDRLLDAVTGCAVTSLIHHWLNTATNTQLSLRGHWKFPHPRMNRFFPQGLLAQVHLYFPDLIGELSCAFWCPLVTLNTMSFHSSDPLGTYLFIMELSVFPERLQLYTVGRSAYSLCQILKSTSCLISPSLSDAGLLV